MTEQSYDDMVDPVAEVVLHMAWYRPGHVARRRAEDKTWGLQDLRLPLGLEDVDLVLVGAKV